jgi:hypothetical protein
MGSYVTPWMDKLHKSSCTNNFYIQNHSSSKFIIFTFCEVTEILY